MTTPMSDRPVQSSPTSEGREETLSQAGRPMPTDADWAVISAIRHELWQASQGRGYGEDRTLVGMVRRVIAERDEARQNRKGEYELRSTAEQEVVTLRASLTEAQAEIERLTNQARSISARLSDAGCPAMPIPDGVVWLVAEIERLKAANVRMRESISMELDESGRNAYWTCPVCHHQTSANEGRGSDQLVHADDCAWENT